MQFQFNARSIAPSQGREVWLGGWYQVVITGHDIKPTQSGKGQRLALAIVGNDDTNGKRGQANEIGLNIGNDNATTVQIAYETLSAICWVVGKPAINDLSELHGIPFYAYTPNEKDAQSNNWRNFKNMQGVDAIALAQQGGGTTARPGQQQGQQQQQQPQFQQQPTQGQQQQQPGGWGQQQGGQPAQGQPAQQPAQQQWQQQPPAQPAQQGQPGNGQQQPQWQANPPAQQQQPAQQQWQQGGQQQGSQAPWQKN